MYIYCSSGCGYNNLGRTHILEVDWQFDNTILFIVVFCTLNVGYIHCKRDAYIVLFVPDNDSPAAKFFIHIVAISCEIFKS